MPQRRRARPAPGRPGVPVRPEARRRRTAGCASPLPPGRATPPAASGRGRRSRRRRARRARPRPARSPRARPARARSRGRRGRRRARRARVPPTPRSRRASRRAPARPESERRGTSATAVATSRASTASPSPSARRPTSSPASSSSLSRIRATVAAASAAPTAARRTARSAPDLRILSGPPGASRPPRAGARPRRARAAASSLAGLRVALRLLDLLRSPRDRLEPGPQPARSGPELVDALQQADDDVEPRCHVDVAPLELAREREEVDGAIVAHRPSIAHAGRRRGLVQAPTRDTAATLGRRR